MGRGSVREAVKLLISRNVLEIRRGKGTYIAESPGVVDDPLGFAFYPDQLGLAMDLLEIRMQLEPWVAAVAAERGTEEEFAEMKARCILVEEDILAGRNHLANDKEYHVSIAQCSHNLVVPKLIPIISYSVGLFGTLNGNRLLTETIIGHRAILDAVTARNASVAADAMRMHLEQNKEELEALDAQRMEAESTEEKP